MPLPYFFSLSFHHFSPFNLHSSPNSFLQWSFRVFLEHCCLSFFCFSLGLVVNLGTWIFHWHFGKLLGFNLRFGSAFMLLFLKIYIFLQNFFKIVAWVQVLSLLSAEEVFNDHTLQWYATSCMPLKRQGASMQGAHHLTHTLPHFLKGFLMMKTLTFLYTKE